MLRKKTQKSWASRGKSPCRLWAAELCTQSLAPPHSAHFGFSAMCSLLLWGLWPSLGALHWREQFLKAKRPRVCQAVCPLHGTGLFLPWVLQILCLSVGCRITEICFWTWSPSSHLQQDWHLCSGELGLCLPWKPARMEMTWPLWAAQGTALGVKQAFPPAWPGAPKLEFMVIAPATSPAAIRRCLAPPL